MYITCVRVPITAKTGSPTMKLGCKSVCPQLHDFWHRSNGAEMRDLCGHLVPELFACSPREIQENHALGTAETVRGLHWKCQREPFLLVVKAKLHPAMKCVHCWANANELQGLCITSSSQHSIVFT